MEKLRKIFIVDDDEISNFLSISVIEELNVANEINSYNDGFTCYEEILKCYKNNNILPELIFFDELMPSMSGVELMKSFHKTIPNIFQEVVFVSLSATPRKKSIEFFKEIGIKEYAEKPLTSESVLNIYNKYWGKEVGV